MVYTFTVFSEEVEDFGAIIKIDSEATFLDLHKTILKACKYSDDQMTSFYTCSDNWEKEHEVTLEDMGDDGYDEKYVMAETHLDELLEEENQKVAYIFDPMAERMLFLELSKVEYSKDLDEPEIVKVKGCAPQQMLDFDDLMTKAPAIGNAADMGLGEDFFGDEGFNEDELDLEGMEFSDGDPYAN